jgi:hypothetical protein
VAIWNKFYNNFYKIEYRGKKQFYKKHMLLTSI